MCSYYKIFLPIFFVLLSAGCTFADNGYVWEFNSERDLNGWGGEGAGFNFLQQEGLLRIEGGAEPVLISPSGLNLSMDRTWFFKIRLRGSAAAYSKGFILFRPKGAEQFFYNPLLSFNIESDKRFCDYSVNLESIIGAERVLDQFSIGFRGASIIEIDSIEIYKPSFVELLWHRLRQGFLTEEIIRGVTINTVTTPMIGKITFPAFLYILAAVISLFIILYRMKFTMYEINTAVIISFICIGFIFALKMDYNWLRIWQNDIRSFSGKDAGQRIVMLEGADLYDFISIVKTIIPEGKKAKRITDSGADYIAIKTKYYLMPIKTSKDGEYAVVYMDPAAVFDPSTQTLIKDRKIIAPHAEEIYNHKNYGFVYRILKDNRK